MFGSFHLSPSFPMMVANLFLKFTYPTPSLLPEMCKKWYIYIYIYSQMFINIPTVVVLQLSLTIFSVCVWIYFAQKMLLHSNIASLLASQISTCTLKALQFVSFNIFTIPFIEHMPFPQQQGALELTETITKPNTSLCQGKASIKTLNLY